MGRGIIILILGYYCSANNILCETIEIEISHSRLIPGFLFPNLLRGIGTTRREMSIDRQRSFISHFYSRVQSQHWPINYLYENFKLFTILHILGRTGGKCELDFRSRNTNDNFLFA